MSHFITLQMVGARKVKEMDKLNGLFSSLFFKYEISHFLSTSIVSLLETKQSSCQFHRSHTSCAPIIWHLAGAELQVTLCIVV